MPRHPKVHDLAIQAPQPVSVGRRSELPDQLSLVAQQAHIDPLATQIQPSVQHDPRASSTRSSDRQAERPTEGALLHGSPERERSGR